MQNPQLERADRRRLAPGAPTWYRRTILLVAGVLVLVLAGVGTVAALGGRRSSSSPARARDQLGAMARPSTIVEKRSSRPPSAQAPVLAAGTYPTYITGVDVHNATITVDVIQVFQDEAAVKAAMQDGKSRSEAMYLYVYIRNQNARLRTLPVARNVRIQFLGECEAPANRNAALTELANKTFPIDATYYYDVTVSGGVIHRIHQRLAIPAC